MEAATGTKPGVELPQPLQTLLAVLMRENSIRSWSLYSEYIGTTLKIRFDTAAIAERQSPMHDRHVNTTEGAAHYTRKGPAKLRRDRHRALKTIHSKKRPRIDDEESEPEVAREAENILDEPIDSPEIVATDRYEDSLVLLPMTPIQISLEPTESNMCEIPASKLIVKDQCLDKKSDGARKIVAIECPNCNELMTNASHVCDDVSTIIDESFENDENEICLIDDGDAKLTKVPELVSVPRISRAYGAPIRHCKTYCSLAGFDKFDRIGHSAHLYHKCLHCGSYICHACKDTVFNYCLGPPCCQKYELDVTTYTESLKPNT